jgi:hypothetical protein
MDGLMRLRRPEEVAELRGLTVDEVLGLHLRPDYGKNGADSTPAETDAAPATEPAAAESGEEAEPAAQGAGE